MLTPITYFIAVTGVAECAAQALEDHVADGTLGRPNRVVVVPGQEVLWDAGQGCSQLGVAFEHGPYPSVRFPVEELEDPNAGCVVGPSAVTCVVSLVRCEYHPPPTNDGKTPPSVAKQTMAALLQCVEEFYVRQAIMCCLFEMKKNYQIDDYRVGATDRQVNGDLGEIAVRFRMQVV